MTDGSCRGVADFSCSPHHGDREDRYQRGKGNGANGIEKQTCAHDGPQRQSHQEHERAPHQRHKQRRGGDGSDRNNDIGCRGGPAQHRIYASRANSPQRSSQGRISLQLSRRLPNLLFTQISLRRKPATSVTRQTAHSAKQSREAAQAAPSIRQCPKPPRRHRNQLQMARCELNFATRSAAALDVQLIQLTCVLPFRTEAERCLQRC